jgi:hypothetical protein
MPYILWIANSSLPEEPIGECGFDSLLQHSCYSREKCGIFGKTIQRSKFGTMKI